MQIVEQIFRQHGDDRGNLIALEEYNDIPFEIKRVYYIYGVKPKVVRGLHAHKSLKQILICINGKCKLKLDDGHEIKIIELGKPYKGVFLDDMVWREMYDFSNDAILMVLASDYYKEEDYIRNYEEFKKLVKEKEDGNSYSNNSKL